MRTFKIHTFKPMIQKMKTPQIDSGVTSCGVFKPQTTRTRYNGTLQDRYECYLHCADDGQGGDITRGGAPLKTFNQWMGGEE
jgi:hypothetical protein